MTRIKRIGIIVMAELFIIVILTVVIYEKQKIILGMTNVTFLSKNDFTFPNSSLFHYYYEPKASQIISPGMKWEKEVVHYTLNADTLNERYDYSIKKPERTFRILSMGDSNTFGVFVNTADNYPEKLEDSLNKNLQCPGIDKFEVINIGVAGYDIPYEVERFRRRGMKYQPDLVIWNIKNFDFSNSVELSMPLREKYEKEMVEKEGKESLSDNTKMVAIITRSVNEVTKKYGESNMKKYLLTEMEKMNDYYKNPLIFAAFSQLEKSPQNTLARFIASRKNTYVFTTTKDIYNEPELSFLPYDHHPSEKGYTFIVSELVNFIKKNHIIPCE